MNSTNINFEPGRKISRETCIDKEKGIFIAAPAESSGYEASLRIKDRFDTLNIKTEILVDPGYDILLRSDRPVIVIGNLAVSKCVTYLYYKFLCITDKYYPGSDGYNIRTILNPFGTGHNIIHIGYSDDNGLESGMNIFIQKCAATLPFFSEVCATQLPLTSQQLEDICKSEVPEDKSIIRSIHSSYWTYMGFIGYMTGDAVQLEKHFTGWQRLLETADEDPRVGNDFHLYSLAHISAWWILEHNGLIPDTLRGRIERLVYNWALSSEGVGYHHDTRGIMPSHNHSMFCAISLQYASDFFKTYYNSQEAAQWHDVIKGVFKSYDNGGWKPLCDDSSYAPNVSLPQVCLYSLYDDDHVFLNNSGKKVVEWLKIILSQNFMIPSYGDGGFNGSFPGCLLMLLSHYFKDGELRTFLEKGNYKEFLNPNLLSYSRVFDSGVSPEEVKASPIISVMPMDRYIYEIWDKDEKAAHAFTPSRPEGPLESCFDKLNIRTGFGKNDEFLLIDGLGNSGIHAYNDAMGILDYTAKGITWLVEEMCYQSEPEKCQILTITKDGYASPIPGYALLEDKSEKADHVYLRMRLKSYSGTDWVREIFFIKGIGFVCKDTVIANEEGEYVICSHFRTTGKVHGKDGLLISNRRNHDGDEYQMRMQAYATCEINTVLDERDETFHVKLLKDLINITIDEKICNASTIGIKNMSNMWNRRYNDDNLVTTTITSRISEKLEKGRAVSMTHVFHIASPESDFLDVSNTLNELKLKYTGNTYSLKSLYSFYKRVGHNKNLIMDMLLLTEIARLNSEIVLVKVINKECFIFALKDNSLVMVRNSDVVWKKELDEKIHSIEYAPYNQGMIFVGWGTNTITAMDMNANTLWENRVIGRTTDFPLWEMLTPVVVAIKYGFTGGVHFVTAGCGDNFIRLFSMTGEMICERYIYATIPDVIELFDLDGDGKLEIMVAGKNNSHRGAFHVLGVDGIARENINIGPWLCIFKSHIIKERDGKLCIACGMNYGENFKKITYEKGKYTLDFSKTLGGTVSAINMDNDTGNFYVGSNKGIVLSFDRHGNDLWYADVQSPVKDIFSYQGGILVLSDNGEIRAVNKDGKVVGIRLLPSEANGYVDEDANVYISRKEYFYRME